MQRVVFRVMGDCRQVRWERVPDTVVHEVMQVNDPDTRAVTTRIHTFLHANQFTAPPEGREMPRFDASGHDRA